MQAWKQVNSRNVAFIQGKRERSKQNWRFMYVIRVKIGKLGNHNDAGAEGTLPTPIIKFICELATTRQYRLT